MFGFFLFLFLFFFFAAKRAIASDESGDDNKSDSDGSEKIKKKWVFL